MDFYNRTENNGLTSKSVTMNNTCVNVGESHIGDFLMAVYILVFILGLIVNILTFGPIYQQVRGQNILGIYLLCLSFSDLLFILTMPLWINYYYQDHHWKLGPISCSIAGFFYYTNMYISIFLLCCISVDRCLVVNFPIRFKAYRTSCHTWAVCIFVYILVGALHILVLVNDNLKDAHDEKNNNDRCYETYPMERPVAFFNLLRVGLGFVIPLLILGVSYWKLLATVRQSPGLTAPAKRKVRLLSYGVIGIFSVCFAPYHILLLARSLVFYLSTNSTIQSGYCQFEQNLHFYFSCSLALSSLNCVVDPVLYVLVSDGVREEMKLTWGRKKKTKRGYPLETYNRRTTATKFI
ncbi:G protein-coupled receptor 184 [Lampris incognitus]|uniref:G protein-coupled receptor 184 n=1 Tax=Lampris incognitus TaxID=2546036 RepID=UPI0024B5B099|nr:G protein-coupled receptor 184 [Lampris incognitus]